MIDFLYNLWPYLAGGLIGWLLAGWFARPLKYSTPAVEKIVEKQIDNPQHLALISKLEGENREIAELRTRISGFESSTASMSSTSAPKTIDNPAHLKRISELESQVTSLKSSTVASNNTAQTALSSTSNTSDNSADLKRIKELEKQVRTLQKGPEIDLAAAKAAGFKLKSDNDLTAIEGIGPKINDLIQADGVKSFSQLADTPVSSIQGILDNAGSRYSIANPGTWPDQANLAANNRWEALGALQDVLVGGIYPNASAKPSENSAASNTTDTKKPTVEKAETSTANTPSSMPKAVVKVKESNVDKVAAKAAGFRVKLKDDRDDFTIVEGIGPKINDLIHDDGIHTYSALGKTKVEAIQLILDAAGPRYKLAKPGTWPAQADMAAANKWEALKAWQDELDGGK
ncbi:MAG: hypothetical protein V7749_03170 [Cocleimonas sp.]